MTSTLMTPVLQIDDIHTYLKNYVPGFEQCYFTKTAPFLGIRETRRIVGHYTMTQEDVLGCRHFDDAIAVASYPIDIHRPGDEGCTLIWCGDCYDIPYRSLLPQNNPKGERYYELGNDTIPVERPVHDRKAVRDAIKAGMEDVRNGRVPPLVSGPPGAD